MTARRVGEDGATDAVERVSNDRLTFLMQHGAGKVSDVPPLCLDLRDCRARLAAAEAQVAALREALASVHPHDPDWDNYPGSYQKEIAAERALADTAAAAQAHDQRVRREVYEQISKGMGAAFVMDAEGIIAFYNGSLKGCEQRVQREERERCAKVADELSEVESHVSGVHSGNAGSLVHEAAAMAGRLTRKSIAAAIRALEDA